MVFFFESNVVSPPAKLYMGLDKYENEDLIRWGWPEDVWFHVDKVKANSIDGNKMNNIDVVYTMWDNLLKSGDMAVGQVGFKKNKQVRKVKVEKRLNEVVNRLNKTKVEKTVDFRLDREERDRKEREDTKARQRDQKQREAEEAKRKEEEKSARSYDILHNEEKMTANIDGGNESDDFM